MASKFSLKFFFEQITDECSFLLRNLKNPEVSKPENVEGITLEFILKTINNLAKYLREGTFSEEKDDPKLEENIEAFQTLHEELSLRRLDVHNKLHELTEGWKCPHCHNSVPIHIGIKGVRRPPMELVIQCRVCDEMSPLTDEGLKNFSLYFGELINNQWNPRANRFLYDYRTDSY